VLGSVAFVLRALPQGARVVDPTGIDRTGMVARQPAPRTAVLVGSVALGVVSVGLLFILM